MQLLYKTTIISPLPPPRHLQIMFATQVGLPSRWSPVACAPLSKRRSDIAFDALTARGLFRRTLQASSHCSGNFDLFRQCRKPKGDRRHGRLAEAVGARPPPPPPVAAAGGRGGCGAGNGGGGGAAAVGVAGVAVGERLHHEQLRPTRHLQHAAVRERERGGKRGRGRERERERESYVMSRRC